MKHVKLIVGLLIIFSNSFGQIQKQEKIATLNAYTFYPAGYDTGKSFPLILFFPGLGEAGTNASLLLRYGPNKFTAEGWRPAALVISVQPTYGWVSNAVIDNVLKDIVKRYKVDTNRIHLTGLSAGGWGISNYALTPDLAMKITTVTPLSSPEVSNMYKNIPQAVKAGVEWNMFCGTQDSHYGKMKDLFNRLVQAGATARFEEAPYGHCCWNNIYDPKSGLYEWMLSKSKGPIVVPPTPPADTTTKVIQIIHDPAKVMRIIILDKNGKWTEYEGNKITTGPLQFISN